MSAIFGGMILEAKHRPPVTPNVDDAFAAFGKASLPVTDLQQSVGATYKAAYCKHGLTAAKDVADRLTYQLTGQYDNRYVKRNDRWYIQVQKFRQTSLLIKKIAEDGSEKVITFGLPDSKLFDK